MRSTITVLVSLAFAASSAAARYGYAVGGGRWSAQERETLRSLSLASLGPLPADPSNRYADDSGAARLGRRLFFDTRLSGNGKVSCASCHVPAQDFQDGIPLGKGVGTAGRRTMPIAGTAYSPWQFWDGRADSQWAQALGPLESAVEHGGDRTQYAHLVSTDPAYRAEYERTFGRIPALDGLPAHAGPVADPARVAAWRAIPATRQDDITRVYANIGKALAAFERRIAPGPSRFDRFVERELAGRMHDSTSAFSRDEEAGLRLFIGKGNCVNCHNGALMADDHFHNTGVAAVATLAVDSGRATGVRQAVAGEFNCTSRYSDANADDCDELKFADTDGPELVRAYKTPSLRGVSARAPYMHAGQFATLEDVGRHYASAPRAAVGHSELARPGEAKHERQVIRLSESDIQDLAALLGTLTGPVLQPR